MLKIKKTGLLLFVSTLMLAISSYWFFMPTEVDVLQYDKSTPKKPNIILIVIDTARADYFSYCGRNKGKTPNIDLFAEESVNYSNAHSVSPWTLPAHMSIFTGLLPTEHGATWSNYSNPPDMTLMEIFNTPFNPKEPDKLLGKRLKDMGYTTLGFSANPWISARTGFSQGFDYFCDTWRLENTKFRNLYSSFPKELKTSPAIDWGDAGRSILLYKSYIAERGLAEPFFLFFNLIDPHFPYYPPKEFAKKMCSPLEIKKIYKNRANELAMLAGRQCISPQTLSASYAAEIYYTDFMIGKLLAFLRDKGIYDNSMIIITSDHGEHLGENGRFSHQLSIKEELLRIPLLIKYPYSENAGKIEKDPLVSNLDIYQTILSAVDSSVKPDHNDREMWSINLNQERGIGREVLVAEYYYSDAYLGQLQKSYQPFNPDLHRVLKRAIYLDGLKITFWNNEIQEVDKPVQKQSDLNRAKTIIEKLSNTYSESQGKQTHVNKEVQNKDDEFIKKLRSLGYVGDDEKSRAKR